MKKAIFKKGIILLAFVVCPGFIFAQKPIQGYEGVAKPVEELVTVKYGGNNMAITLWVFKVDGKLTSDLNSFFYTYNSPRGNINLQLLPGKHELEIQRTTNNPQIVAFTGEAGKEYELISEKDLFKIVERTDNKPKDVEFTIREVPLYSEIRETEPCALLIEDGKLKGKTANGVTTLFRIDGLPGKVLMRGWVAHHMFNNWVNLEYTVRLTPGEHSIDFYGASGDFRNIVPQTEKFNFEAGKTYTIVYEMKKYNDYEYMQPSLIEVK